MKLGQMLSMEGESILPPELSSILAQLRDDAAIMPREQLNQTMQSALGADWKKRFDQFDMQPIASASIGQVHRATVDGKPLAVKVQYPGIADSIDSDVDNMATLLSLTRVLPTHIDIDQLLLETKQQLHLEADYAKEADFLNQFQQVLGNDRRFRVPQLHRELSGKQVLTMEFVEGEPIESLQQASLEVRNQAIEAMLELCLNELFDWRLMQTDPNFANYRVQVHENDIGSPQEGKHNVTLALLDFGATRTFSRSFSATYRKLAKAVIEENDEELLAAASNLGYALEDADEAYLQLILDIFYLALEPLRIDEPYDFKAADLPLRIAELAQQGGNFKEFWQAPPIDALFLHRKIGGMFMLAQRLDAKVNVHRLIKEKIKHVRFEKKS